jgi:heterotetrameric sarcosine oxidase delta subunit
MSFLLSCPFCGRRPVDEYAYFGEVTTRPAGSPSLRELTDYVYFRDNVAGVQREWWQHRMGCGEWFLAERDTRTNEVLEVVVPDPQRQGVRPVGSDPAGPQTGVRPHGTDPAGAPP